MYQVRKTVFHVISKHREEELNIWSTCLGVFLTKIEVSANVIGYRHELKF